MLFALFLLLQATPPLQRVDAPREFVAFSADLKITNARRPDAFGRHLQDEHGCMRRETIFPEGSPMVVIMNFQTEKMYRLGRTGWTEQPMRVVPGLDRRPRSIPVVKKVEPIEGFEAWLARMEVTRMDVGTKSVRESIVIPALNFFEPVLQQGNGDTITAHNIRRGPVDHAEFLPPASVVPMPVAEPGGSMQFQAVAVRIEMPGRAASIDTLEEMPTPVKTLGDIAINVTVLDPAKHIVRVRFMANAKRPRPGVVTGDVLDEVVVALGQTARTTKLAENCAVTITRVGKEFPR